MKADDTQLMRYVIEGTTTVSCLKTTESRLNARSHWDLLRVQNSCSVVCRWRWEGGGEAGMGCTQGSRWEEAGLGWGLGGRDGVGAGLGQREGQAPPGREEVGAYVFLFASFSYNG